MERKFKVRFSGTIDQNTLYDLIKEDIENKHRISPDIPVYIDSILVYGNLKSVNIDDHSTVTVIVDTKKESTDVSDKDVYVLLNTLDRNTGNNIISKYVLF